MKLKFDSNLKYQLEAIQGVTDLFEGLPRNREGFETKTSQEQDRMLGRRPIEYVQATRPILIIDEPQSVDNTPKSQKAISNLNPLFALRYSATHTNPHNLLYQLDPIRAYDMRIVKQIEVVDARGGQDFNKTMVRLDAVATGRKRQKPRRRK